MDTEDSKRQYQSHPTQLPLACSLESRSAAPQLCRQKFCSVLLLSISDAKTNARHTTNDEEILVAQAFDHQVYIDFYMQVSGLGTKVMPINVRYM